MQDTLASGDLAELLREALRQGHAVILPTPVRPIEGAPAAPDTEAPLVVTLRLRLGLRRAESRVLVALMAHEHVSREALHAAMSPDSWARPNSRTVDVTLCGMRKKLEPHGVEIVNVYGLGFALAEGARDKLRRIARYGVEPAQPEPAEFET